MVSRILLRKVTKIALNYVNDIINIISPLHALDINHFTYSQFSHNSRVVCLSSNLEFMQHYEKKITAYRNESFTENQVITHSGVNLLSPQNLIFSNSDIKELDKIGEIHKDQIKFGMKNWVVIKNFNFYKNQTEMFWFYSPFKGEKGINALLNSLPSLHIFSLYFKCRAKKIIEKAKINKDELATICPALEINEEFYRNQPVYIKNERLDLNVRHYYLGYPFSENYLSRRELECLKFFFLGKSAKQISNELGISYRTVEKHIENIRIKANVSDYHELRQKLFCCQSFTGLFHI